MLPADIAKVRVPGHPSGHGLPGRDQLVLVDVERPDPVTDRNISEIWRVSNNKVSRWTAGEADTSPVISPDGRAVAFLREVRANGRLHPQLHVISTTGGEARQITALPLGATTPVWSPNSTHIATTAPIPEPGRYRTESSTGAVIAPATEPARHIRRLDFQRDNVGYLLDRPRQLVVVEVAQAIHEPVSEALTALPCSVGTPTWTPSGDAVLVPCPRDLGAHETLDSDLYRINLQTGDASLVLRSEGSVSHVAFGQDGTLLYLGASHAAGAVAEPAMLWASNLLDSSGATRGVPITDRATVDIADHPIVFDPRTGDVLIGVLHRGAVEVRSVPWRGLKGNGQFSLDELPCILGGPVVVQGFAVTGSLLVASVASPTSAGEIVAVDLAHADLEPQTWTNFSAELRQAGIRPVEELTGTSPDGYPLHGWVVAPEGDGPHPVIRLVHGGPHAQDTWALFDEAQVYASAGYAVVIGNPRGSAGYGLAHGQAILGSVGTVDVDDVLALLDVALERDDLDGSRVGIMGGSYGGFMTSWLAAHHGDRFVAAWSERAVNAWDSFSGSSDIGWYFADAYAGNNPEEQRQRSPLTYADSVSIPFMVAHSENDLRCPIEQGQRQFVALRRAGVDADLLVFPGEGHELSRSGRPSHRINRFDHVLSWWNRHLRTS